MNQVIQSLIDRAAMRDDGEVDPEKLVELTVTECLRIMQMKDKRPVTNRHWEAIGRELAYFIKDQFGME